jgi:hypothetical protein
MKTHPVRGTANMKLISFLLMAASAFAGQSIEFGPHLIYSSTPVPNTPANRLEFYIHDWSSVGSTHVVSGGSTGWLVYTQVVSPTNVILLIYNQWDIYGQGQLAQIQLSPLPQHAVYVRCQHDPANKLDLIEAWDINGNRVANNSLSYVSETPAGTDFQMGYGREPSMSVGFMRVHSSLVPLNSRPPVTSDSNNRVFEWKFDSDQADASGNGHTAIYYGGTPVYSQTPHQNTIAIIKTKDSTSWSNVVTQRAGYPAELDGTSSYSQSDGSASVRCFWQQVSGPSVVQFNSRSSCSPVITGLVFGDYLMQLTVTDVDGNPVTTTTDIGAVAMDNKGIVVNADPNVDALFGNMIAFGKNPWGFADHWAQHAMTLRSADYVSNGWTGLQWEQTGSGTTSYYWNGVGYSPGNPALGTILQTGITATATTLTVSDASKLDLTELPTRIIMLAGNYPSASEEIRICAITGNTLTVCYDGRGQSPQIWNGGARVAQAKVTGQGTRFLTDTTAPVCPVGAPGPPGPASFSSGSVTLTAGSTTMTGTGTNWAATGASAPTPGDFVRVSAKHGGVPFQFIAQSSTGGALASASVSGGAIATVVANVTSGAVTSYTVISGGANYSNPAVLVQPTVVALNRPYPADADSGTYFGYAIMPAHRTIVLRSQHAVDKNGTGEAMWNTTGCESETAVYLNPTTYGNSFSSGHDSTALDGSFQNGYLYSVTDSNGWVNQSTTGGISFYGESLGSRALYYRSGLTSALDAANVIDDNLIKSPWANRDVSGGPVLWSGGAAIGAFVSGILTGRVPWGDLRSYAASAEYIMNGVYNGGTPNCEYDDTRDTGYAYAWLILSAIYDPDTSPGGFRSRWRSGLAKMQANDSACKRSDGSWANGFLWNTGFGPVTLTANSTAVTGTGLLPSACTGTASGTGTVTNGSATITQAAGTFPVSGANTLVITGTLGGSSFTGSYLYTGSGSSVALSVLWPGDSGPVTWMAVNIPNLSTNSGAMTSFATGTSDYADLAHNYACIWNSATSLTLDHPWNGATGSNFYGYLGNLSGFGQQPFMLGIKTYGMGLLAAATDPELATYAGAYKQFNREATQWIHDKGVDANTLTTNYGRGFAFCEPTTTTSSTSFDTRTPGCNYGTSISGRAVGREQNQELGNAVAGFYLANPTDTNRVWGDSVYGAVWGNPAYNTGGAYYDSASDAMNIGYTNLLDSYIHAGKWYGFFAGMGMLHRWPAVRLGGVDPEIKRTVYVPFTLAGVSGATQTRMTITQASGATATQICSASPCAVTVDARSGSVLMKMDYLSSSGRLLAPGDSIPLYVPR